MTKKRSLIVLTNVPSLPAGSGSREVNFYSGDGCQCGVMRLMMARLVFIPPH